MYYFVKVLPTLDFKRSVLIRKCCNFCKFRSFFPVRVSINLVFMFKFHKISKISTNW